MLESARNTLLKNTNICLMKMCKDAGIEKYSGQNKKFLVEMLLQNDSNSQSKEDKNKQLGLFMYL